MSSRFALRPERVEYSENDVERVCLKLARRYGYYPVRQHVGRFRTPNGNWVTMGTPGDPDWLLAAPGSVFMEAKRPGEQPTDVQRKRHAELRMGYGFDIVIVQAGEQLRDWLERLERAP